MSFIDTLSLDIANTKTWLQNSIFGQIDYAVLGKPFLNIYPEELKPQQTLSQTIENLGSSVGKTIGTTTGNIIQGAGKGLLNPTVIIILGIGLIGLYLYKK